MSGALLVANDDLLTQWALLLVGCLEQLGVRDVIISPGSRSTPLTWAFTSRPSFRTSSIIDERSAAFYALGQAKYTGAPSVLLCTSGSAAANYLPAIVEASLARVPLLVLTADRPLELQQADAAQTIDQVKLYGDFVRAFFDLGLPDAAAPSLRALRRTLIHAVALSQGPSAGPVHLNFRAKKPLEPSGLGMASEVAAQCAEILRNPAVALAQPEREITQSRLAHLVTRIASTQRRAVVLGPQAMWQPELGPALVALSRVARFSLFCEATSQLRFALPQELEPHTVDAFDWLYSTSGAKSLAPDFVLQLGAPPTSAHFSRLLEQVTPLELHVVATNGYPDPEARAASMTWADPVSTVAKLASALQQRRVPTDNEWHARLAQGNATVWNRVEQALQMAKGEPELNEALAVRTIVNRLPQGALLAVGNSLPVRELDHYVHAGALGLRVLSQRGANGIDGVLSASAGAAACHAGPTLVLLGDISFLHDVGALWAARSLSQPFVIAVLNNGGGRIFEQLPLMKSDLVNKAQRDYWLTPQSLELGHAASLFGIESQRVGTLAELEQALASALCRPAATLLDIRVGSKSAALTQQKLRSALAEAL